MTLSDLAQRRSAEWGRLAALASEARGDARRLGRERALELALLARLAAADLARVRRLGGELPALSGALVAAEGALKPRRSFRRALHETAGPIGGAAALFFAASLAAYVAVLRDPALAAALAPRELAAAVAALPAVDGPALPDREAAALA